MICVVKDGEYKVAQYGQWDGYPSGQGVAILDFLKSKMVDAFKENVIKCSWATKEDIFEYWSEFGYNPYADKGIPYEIGDKFCEKYPEFSRDTGADILKIVAESSHGIKLRNDVDFARDSLFCEWAYVVDLDKNTFEVYKGFNEEPLDQSERFYTEELMEYHGGSQYYPVKLKASFELSNLPSKEDFLAICEPKEE